MANSQCQSDDEQKDDISFHVWDIAGWIHIINSRTPHDRFLAPAIDLEIVGYRGPQM